MKTADITIVTSVKNEEDFIGSTIKSILNQTYKNFEFWIIDDGSTDHTWEVISTFKDKRIKAIRFNNNTGLTNRLNWVIPQIKTPFIARMDSHHLADKYRLEKQRNYMLKNIEVFALGANYSRVNKEGKLLLKSKYPTKYIDIKNTLMKKNVFRHSSLLFRRAVYNQIGLYDKYFLVAQDYDFILRVAAKFPVANLKEDLISEVYRLENMTQKHRVRSAWEALVAQLNGIFRYGYPVIQSIYLIRGIGFLLKSIFIKPV